MDKSIKNIQDCYGCGVCSTVCPQKIIDFTLNKNGFYQPKILDIKACTNCGLCKSICSFINKVTTITPQNNIHAFSTFSKDPEIRYSSSSGGTGFEIAKFALFNGYQVCAVKYNNKKNIAEHFIAHNMEELRDSKGSKYIPSNTIQGIKAIDWKLPFIIFGTPCQIASIRRLMGKKKQTDYILVDFFCHGTPSMLLWRKYLNEKSNELGKIDSVYWRNKKYGWHDSWNMTFHTNDNKYYSSRYTKGDLFYHFFLGNMCLNKACYKNCKFKNLNSAADIRLGDLWGKKYENNSKGITGIITLTPKGLEIIEKIESIEKTPEPLEIVTEGQLKNRLKIPFYRNLTLQLLKTPLSLSSIRNFLKVIRVFEILQYKLRI